MKRTLIAAAVVLAASLLMTGARAQTIQEFARDGELSKVTALLEKHPDALDARDKDGMTPLAGAALGGELEIVKMLLKKGADPMIRDQRKQLPYHHAAQSGDEDVLALLLDLGIDVDDRAETGDTALIIAASHRKASAVELLIGKGADVNATNKTGWSSLLFAVIHGNKYLVNLLLEKGADPDVATENGIRPLHSAASFGRTRIASLLLEAGADPEAENNEGETPLSWALNRNSIGTARLLIDAGADVTHRNKYGITALHNAVQRGTLPIAGLFLDHGANIDAKDDRGWSPLTYAAFSGAEAVKFLLDRGAALDMDGGPDTPPHLTPIHAAATHGGPECVKLFLKAGADPDVLNDEGYTPFPRRAGPGMPGLGGGAARGGRDPGSGREQPGPHRTHHRGDQGTGRDRGRADRAGRRPRSPRRLGLVRDGLCGLPRTRRPGGKAGRGHGLGRHAPEPVSRREAAREPPSRRARP